MHLSVESKLGSELLQDGRATSRQMVEAISCDERIQTGRLEEFEAFLLETLTTVLLGQHERGHHRARVNAPAQVFFADELEPLEAKPVRGFKQVPMATCRCT